MSGGYLMLDLMNAVRVGQTVLPGVLTSLNVSGELSMSQDSLEGTSSNVTTIEGFTTATVTLEITLIGSDEERRKQLAVITGTFQKSPLGMAQGSGGYHWRVTNHHLDARKIREMVFRRFSSRDGNEDDTTTCSLEFTEIEPESARLERRAQEQKTYELSTDPVTGKPMAQVAPTGQTPQPNPDPKTQGVPDPLKPFSTGRTKGLSRTLPFSSTVTKELNLTLPLTNRSAGQ